MPVPLPVPARFQKAVADVSGIYGAWIAAKAQAIRQAGDPLHYITVGYNTVYGLLPINGKMLDFVAHHAYPNGRNLTFTLDNATDARWEAGVLTMLAANWAALNQTRPIVLGEFGTSDGDTASPCPRQPGTSAEDDDDGAGAPPCYVSLQESCAYDATVWLQSVAAGLDGALRWRFKTCHSR